MWRRIKASDFNDLLNDFDQTSHLKLFQKCKLSVKKKKKMKKIKSVSLAEATFSDVSLPRTTFTSPGLTCLFEKCHETIREVSKDVIKRNDSFRIQMYRFENLNHFLWRVKEDGRFWLVRLSEALFTQTEGLSGKKLSFSTLNKTAKCYEFYFTLRKVSEMWNKIDFLSLNVKLRSRWPRSTCEKVEETSWLLFLKPNNLSWKILRFWWH